MTTTLVYQCGRCGCRESITAPDTGQAASQARWRGWETSHRYGEVCRRCREALAAAESCCRMLAACPIDPALAEEFSRPLEEAPGDDPLIQEAQARVFSEESASCPEE